MGRGDELLFCNMLILITSKFNVFFNPVVSVPCTYKRLFKRTNPEFPLRGGTRSNHLKTSTPRGQVSCYQSRGVLTCYMRLDWVTLGSQIRLLLPDQPSHTKVGATVGESILSDQPAAASSDTPGQSGTSIEKALLKAQEAYDGCARTCSSIRNL